MKKVLLLTIAVLLKTVFTAAGQSGTFYLVIPDSSGIAYIDSTGGMTSPVFTDPSINGMTPPFGITSFSQAFPASNYLSLRQVYRVECNDTNLASMLHTFYPTVFPRYEILQQHDLLSQYTPNDWDGSLSYLDYIHAREAWADTAGTHKGKGDSSVIIGITDTYFDLTNLDFQGKVVRAGPNYNSGSEHGTSVAGLAAGGSDNGIYFPSIGYKCRLDLSTNWADDGEMLTMSQRPMRKVLNASWYNALSFTLDLSQWSIAQGVYNEIYENGTTTCASAGNGHSSGCINPRTFISPAALNHVIATTGIGHDHTTYGTDPICQQDVHFYDVTGDTDYTTQNNVRVDICAPYCYMNTLGYSPTDTSRHTNTFWETSAASPVTAGTCGLVYANNPCLTPYQVEYIIKKSSHDVYGITYNAQYAGPTRWTGRLGAGALRADSAVFMAHEYECNNPTTATLYIDGVSINHICAPGVTGGVSLPQLSVVVSNGTPPYTYTWEALGDNSTTLNSYTSGSPQIIAYTSPGVAFYRVTVYDASEIQQVASKEIRIQLQTNYVSDLAMRDSYVDMLDEPNSQYNVNHNMYDIWHSPDLWNRDTADGGPDHEDPQYFAGGYPNYLYVKVRNVGCKANDSDATALHLYWTNSSTGEQWQNDWDGTTLLASSGSPLPAAIPGGGEITTGTGGAPGPLVVPKLNPGDSVTLVVPWHPTKPENFAGSPSHVDVCVLARLLESTLPNNGLAATEVTRSASNVNNNNNIVTRNFSVINLGKKCKTCRMAGVNDNNTHRVYIANAESHDQIFTVDMVTQRDIEKFRSGDISKYAYVTLALGALYDRWQSGGGIGNYAAVNAETKTITYDPSTPLRLEGINLHAGEHFPVDITFVLRNGVNVPYEIKNFNVYIRQVINEGKGNQVYGAVVYNVNIGSTEGTPTRPSQQSVNTTNKVESSPYYSVYPNPVSGMLSIRYTGTVKASAEITLTDITGKTVIHKSGVIMQSGGVTQIKMAQLTSGTYFIRIEDSANNIATQKITKE